MLRNKSDIYLINPVIMIVIKGENDSFFFVGNDHGVNLSSRLDNLLLIVKCTLQADHDPFENTKKCIYLIFSELKSCKLYISNDSLIIQFYTESCDVPISIYGNVVINEFMFEMFHVR